MHAQAIDGVALTQRHVLVDGLRLHVAQAGPEDGPLVLLLHGFPESWLAWRRQLPALARAGYWTWAPVGRGYDTSDKPASLFAYSTDRLAGDVVGLLNTAGRATAHVVGHDWGGVVAWRLAELHPERVERLVIINAPHPTVFRQTLLASPRQLVRSAYAAFFQLPLLPEAVLRARNFQALARGLERSSRPGTFSEADFAAYRQAWARPGALGGMLNWYRAALRAPPRYVTAPRIRVPTSVLWGVHDLALGTEMARPSVDLCDHGALTLFADATHWLQHEEGAAVNRAIVSFLGAP